MHLEVRRHCGGDDGDYWLFLCCGGGGDQSSLNLMMKSLISISLWKWFAHSHRLRSWRMVAAAAFAAGCVGWGREGRPHASLAIAGLDGHDNCNGNWLSKKRGWTREKERGDWKMGLFFMFSYFVIVFWLIFFNAGLLISYQDQVNFWTGFSCKISLPVIQIWSSHFCWAIIVWESIVANSCIRHWHETGLQTF